MITYSFVSLELNEQSLERQVAFVTSQIVHLYSKWNKGHLLLAIVIKSLIYYTCPFNLYFCNFLPYSFVLPQWNPDVQHDMCSVLYVVFPGKNSMVIKMELDSLWLWWLRSTHSMVIFAVNQQNLKSEVKSNRAKGDQSVTLQLLWLTSSPRCPAGEPDSIRRH